MSLTADLTFLSGFLERYQDTDAQVFQHVDPMTGLTKALNSMQTLVEDRTDMAAPLENLLYSLMQAGG